MATAGVIGLQWTKKLSVVSTRKQKQKVFKKETKTNIRQCPLS